MKLIFLINILLIFGFGFMASVNIAEADEVGFNISEATIYDISSNTVYLTICELLDKDQNINISHIYSDHNLTRNIEYTTILLNQSYTHNITGLVNTSLGKYKTIEVVEECVNITICEDVTHYYADNGSEMFCDYVLEDKSCLVVEEGIISTETRYDYLPVPNVKEKVIIEGKQIENKQGGIPIPKSSCINLKITYNHPLSYGLFVPENANKYNISVVNFDGSDSGHLDPGWHSTNWKQRYNITINNTDSLAHIYEIITINETLFGTMSCNNSANALTSTRIVRYSDNSTIPYQWRVSSDRSFGLYFINNGTVASGTTNTTGYAIYCNKTNPTQGNSTIFLLADDEEVDNSANWVDTLRTGRVAEYSYNTTNPVDGIGSLWMGAVSNDDWVYQNFTTTTDGVVYALIKGDWYSSGGTAPGWGLTDSSDCIQDNNFDASFWIDDGSGTTWNLYDTANRNTGVTINATTTYQFKMEAYNLDQADGNVNVYIQNKRRLSGVESYGVVNDVGCMYFYTDASTGMMWDDIFITHNKNISRYRSPSIISLGAVESAPAGASDTCTLSTTADSDVDCGDSCNFSVTDVNGYNVFINGTGLVRGVMNITNATRIKIWGGCRARANI